MGICDIAKISNFADLMAFMEAFSVRGASAFARSLMTTVATGKGFGQADQRVAHWMPNLAMMCAELSLPPPDLPPGAGEFARVFAEQAVVGVQGSIQTLCLNRARQRRRMRRHIEDWANLHQHAINADNSQDFQIWMESSSLSWLSPADGEDEAVGPLTTWVEKESAKLLLQHLLLGFELEVYAPQEYSYLFWYCDYLNGLQESNPRKEGAGSKSKATKHSAVDSGPSPTFLRLRTQTQDAAVERVLCQAFTQLSVALGACGVSPTKDAAFNTEEQRYEQRFAAFQRLSRPQYLSYDQFCDNVRIAKLTPHQLVEIAKQGFRAARNGIQKQLMEPEQLASARLAALTGMDRVCKHNGVALGLLGSLLGDKADRSAGASSLTASWDFSHHPHFPVVQLKHIPAPSPAEALPAEPLGS
eukprot:jgi/Botrbrau1/6936/Bobra.0215s0015.1